MKGAPPIVEFLLNLCPLCVIAMPLITILMMIKLMGKHKGSTVVVNLDEATLDDESDKS